VFRASSADPGVFPSKVDKHIIILAIHVDDCTLTGSSPELIAKYKRKFNDPYTLTDLRSIHQSLGIMITRDRSARTISLSQTSFIDSIPTRFGLGNAKPYGTPMAPEATYSCEDCASDATEAARM